MLGHRQIQQQNVGLHLPSQSYRFGAIGRFTDHFQIRLSFEKPKQAIAENWMVVGDYDTHGL
jgi:hypothetical protein